MAKFEMSEQEKIERARRLKLRLVALQRHSAARGPDGKSALAVEAGRCAGAIAVQRAGSGEILGLMLALRRWHPEGSRVSDKVVQELMAEQIDDAPKAGITTC